MRQAGCNDIAACRAAFRRGLTQAPTRGSRPILLINISRFSLFYPFYVFRLFYNYLPASACMDNFLNISTLRRQAAGGWRRFLPNLRVSFSDLSNTSAAPSQPPAAHYDNCLETNQNYYCSSSGIRAGLEWALAH